MLDKREHGLQRRDRGPRAARNIHNQAGAQGPRHGAAHGSERRLLQPFAAHVLAKAVEDAIADLPGRFGRNIAEGNAGAAGRHHQPCPASLFANFGGNPLPIVGNDQVAVHSKTGLPQANCDLGPGTIDPKTLETGVADSNDDCVHNCDFTFPGTIQAWEQPPKPWNAKE